MLALPRTIRRWSFPRLDSTVALLAMVAVLVALLVFFASFPRVLAPAPTPAASATGPARLPAPNVVGKRLSAALGHPRGNGLGVVHGGPDTSSRGLSCPAMRQRPPAAARFEPGGQGAA